MKTWEKPKLVILVRSQPQEQILQICKVRYGVDPGVPDGSYSTCMSDVDLACQYYCSSEASS